MSDDSKSTSSFYVPRGISVGGCLTPQITQEPYRRRTTVSEPIPRTSVRKAVLSATKNRDGYHSNMRAEALKCGFAKVDGKWVRRVAGSKG